MSMTVNNSSQTWTQLPRISLRTNAKPAPSAVFYSQELICLTALVTLVAMIGYLLLR